MPGYVWPRKPMRAVRRSRTADAASSHSPSTSQAESPSRSVPVTVRYGIPARVNAPASSGTQQAEQLASHSPVVIGFVVERPRRLQIEDHDRRIDRLHDRQDLRRRRIGRRVEQHEVGSRRGERRARLSSGLGSVDESCGDDLGAERLEPRLDPALVALEPLAQARRTAASTQRGRSRRCRLSRSLRLRRCGAVPARLRAAQPRAGAPVDVARVRDDDACEEEAADDDVLILGGHEVGVSAV